MQFLRNDLFIEIKQRDYTWGMHQCHFHDSYEIFFLAEGERAFLFDCYVYDLKPGDLILLRPNVLHKGSFSSFHVKYGAEFSQEFLDYYFTKQMQDKLLRCFKNNIIRLSENEQYEFKRLFAKMHDEYRRDEICALTLSELLLMLDTAGDRSGLALLGSTGAPAKVSDGVNSILTYVGKHYPIIRSIEEIADGVHLNKSYMCRLFKRETGMTVMDYLQHYRIQQACEKLTATENKITDIAHECGFENTSHFIRVFKDFIGSTPGQFRKSCNEYPPPLHTNFRINSAEIRSHRLTDKNRGRAKHKFCAPSVFMHEQYS